MSDAWLARIQRSNPAQRQVLSIARLVGGSDAARQLQTGDILLAIDGQPVTQFRDVERAVAERRHRAGDRLARVRRADARRAHAALTGSDVERVVQWAGATLQAPHRASARSAASNPAASTWRIFPSVRPASRYGLVPGRRIVEVDGQPTPDLDAFLKQVTGRADRSSLRIKTLGWNGAVEMITLKLDRHYWPAYELRRSNALWERVPLE